MSYSPESVPSKRDRRLVLFLRVVGIVDLLAVFAVVMPYSLMNWTHERLGLGTLPTEPIVGYLARSTSMLYALLGGLALALSSDVSRFRPVIRFVSYSILVAGVVLFGIDLAEKLPLYWLLFEGPVVLLLGLTLRVLSTPSAEERAASG